MLRRCGSAEKANNGDVVEIDGLCLQESTRRVNADGVSIELGPTEFRLLHFLMQHPERVYSRAELIGYVWPPNVYVEERTVDVHIRNLRLALEPSGRRGMIQTVRSAGYRLSSSLRVPCQWSRRPVNTRLLRRRRAALKQELLWVGAADPGRRSVLSCLGADAGADIGRRIECLRDLAPDAGDASVELSVTGRAPAATLGLGSLARGLRSGA